jgi:hypothetical protein
MKIKGIDLQKKLDGNAFVANHLVDPDVEYLYGFINDNTPYADKTKYIRDEKLNGSRSATIDGVIHLWKPLSEETLVKKKYDPEIVQVAGRSKKSSNIEVSKFEIGKIYDLDMAASVLGTSKTTVSTMIKALEKTGAITITKKRPLLFKRKDTAVAG